MADTVVDCGQTAPLGAAGRLVGRLRSISERPPNRDSFAARLGGQIGIYKISFNTTKVLPFAAYACAFPTALFHSRVIPPAVYPLVSIAIYV